MGRSVIRVIDDALAALIHAGSFLVLPLALLLGAQWPLRDLAHGWSREANDLAQLVFGLYISIAITHATRTRSHLTAHGVARRYSPRLRRWLGKLTGTFLILPWAGFVLYAATPMVWQSIGEWERFPDTFNPGYFVLKLAVLLLVALMAIQIVLDWFSPAPVTESAGEA